MNLHSVVSGAISAINPMQRISIQVSTGSFVDPNGDGSRIPQYAPPQTISGQLQALSYSAMMHADALNIQGIRRSLYINGAIDGLVRSKNKGGDLVTTADGQVWLVVEIHEQWPTWTHAIVVLQDGS